MLNWDTGLGIARWMKSKTWAYAQQGLLAIARAEHFHHDPRYGPWAKHLFDRGLALYETMLVDGDSRAYPSAHLYGVTAAHQGTGDQRVFSARMAANAARAVTEGLGAMPAPEPPPFYAFDADIGRLAVSTPRYATAIVAQNRSAFPYGGVELARLFDAAGRPVGGLGGRGRAAFGLVVRGAGRQIATQTSRRSAGAIALTRSPRGPVRDARRLPARPDAGPFAELEAVAATTARARRSSRVIGSRPTTSTSAGRSGAGVTAHRGAVPDHRPRRDRRGDPRGRPPATAASGRSRDPARARGPVRTRDRGRALHGPARPGPRGPRAPYGSRRRPPRRALGRPW